MASRSPPAWRLSLTNDTGIGCFGRRNAHGLQLYVTFSTFESTLFPLLRAAEVICLIAAGCFTLIVILFRKKVPIWVVIGLFAIAPVRSVLSNWSDAEQRGHLFGYWFGHDMFTPPFGLYPEMARDAILFGGTDPGRFCPTYMILPRASFHPDANRSIRILTGGMCNIITQNALADHTYLNYIRAHYNRSTQHDPYFFSELARSDEAVSAGGRIYSRACCCQLTVCDGSGRADRGEEACKGGLPA